MVCPKCGSEDVNTQIVTKTELKNKHKGVAWWLFLGWWWIPVKWIFFTFPALIIKLFGHKKQKIVQNDTTMFVCNNCGHSWEA